MENMLVMRVVDGGDLTDDDEDNSIFKEFLKKQTLAYRNQK